LDSRSRIGHFSTKKRRKVKFEFELDEEEAQVVFSALNKYSVEMSEGIMNRMTEMSIDTKEAVAADPMIKWYKEHKKWFDGIRKKMNML
jgi:hypothetical protein